jgi:hypothetical protein
MRRDSFSGDMSDTGSSDPAGSSTDARAARINPVICVHLTEYAHGCGTYSVNDARRWRTFLDRSPEAAMRAVLHRLRRTPHQVRVRTEDPPLTEAELAEVAELGFVPVATIWEGLSAADASEILANLAAANWRPSSVLEIVE